jgi:putative membrane protein
MRIILTILLLILLVIFTIQNSEIVVIKVFFWIFEIPEALLIIICIIIGLLIGLLIPKRKAKSVKKEDNDSDDVF